MQLNYNVKSSLVFANYLWGTDEPIQRIWNIPGWENLTYKKCFAISSKIDSLDLPATLYSWVLWTSERLMPRSVVTRVI